MRQEKTTVSSASHLRAVIRLTTFNDDDAPPWPTVPDLRGGLASESLSALFCCSFRARRCARAKRRNLNRGETHQCDIRFQIKKGLTMAEAVYKVIELVGTSSDSWEKATAAAINRAAKTLRDLRVAEIVKLDVQLKNGKIEAYRSRISVSFKYESGQ